MSANPGKLFFVRALCLAAVLACCTACMAQGPHVKLKGKTYSVEVADDPREQQLGLMFRESMPEDHGMLFVFAGETRRSFWMKNTRIPLDIIYFDADLKLVSVANAKPCKTPQCPSYPSDGPAMYVLELNAGQAEALDLQPGDELEIRL